MTREQGINQVFGGGGQCCNTWCGASIALTMRNAELNGKRLTDNFTEVLELQDLVDKVPEELRNSNFEKLYGNLHTYNPKSEVLLGNRS
jgi:hypothetical protein